MRPAAVEEIAAGDPCEVVRANAVAKALAVEVPAPSLVLGADTIVAVDGEVLGKPRDEQQARTYLARLVGREHEVHGGLALVRDGELWQVSSTATTVTFLPLDGRGIDRYVATGEWRGRAGGYAIQGRGAALALAVDGDFYNVVGLPVSRLVQMAPELLERDL